MATSAPYFTNQSTICSTVRCSKKQKYDDVMTQKLLPHYQPVRGINLQLSMRSLRNWNTPTCKYEILVWKHTHTLKNPMTTTTTPPTTKHELQKAPLFVVFHNVMNATVATRLRYRHSYINMSTMFVILLPYGVTTFDTWNLYIHVSHPPAPSLSDFMYQRHTRYECHECSYDNTRHIRHMGWDPSRFYNNNRP